MRESVGSLRAYFILSGLAGAFSVIRVNLLSAGILGVTIGLITIGLGAAFVYVGLALRRLLKHSAGRIVTLLYASAGWTVFAFVLSLLAGPSPVAVVMLGVSLLILWYLLRNVRRLAAEAKVASGEAGAATGAD